MKYSQLFAKTRKEALKYEQAANAKLLIRAGFIDKLMSGSYTLLPLGFRVKEKIQTIIREELNNIGSQEVLMPLLHPKSIWNETGRWDSASEVMYKLEKNHREYALSFTHEEIVMDLIRKYVSSYKDLPVAVYHFSTKFRDELRAKSGILRGREFLMKDLYSAHANEKDMWEFYWKVADAYLSIFKRMDLNAIVAEAAGGVFTDRITHEFQIESAVGEDTIYIADEWTYAKNDEVMKEEDRKAANLRSITAIEAGNIFAFGTDKYARSMNGVFTNVKGDKEPVWFASYGIGVTRLIGILAEVFHDDRGLSWPKSVAPYDVHLISISSQNQSVIKKAKQIYQTLTEKNIEVLWDDREDTSAGAKFADCDLIGIPYRLVISEKTGDKIEVKKRTNQETELVSVDSVISSLLR